MQRTVSRAPPRAATSAADASVATRIEATNSVEEDVRSGDARVWWRHLASTTGEREVASSQPGPQQAPALSGRALAYQSNAIGTWDIYLVSNLPP